MLKTVSEAQALVPGKFNVKLADVATEPTIGDAECELLLRKINSIEQHPFVTALRIRLANGQEWQVGMFEEPKPEKPKRKRVQHRGLVRGELQNEIWPFVSCFTKPDKLEIHRNDIEDQKLVDTEEKWKRLCNGANSVVGGTFGPGNYQTYRRVDDPNVLVIVVKGFAPDRATNKKLASRMAVQWVGERN